MRFLFISNIYPPHVRGGYELGCQTIAQEIQRLGHEVRVATSLATSYLKNAPADSTVPVEFCFEPVFCYEPHLHRTLQSSQDWRAYRCRAFAGVIPGNALALARLLERYEPDVIWVFNPLGLGPVGILEACLTRSARCVIHLMDDIDGVIQGHSQRIFSIGRFARLKRHFNAISCSFKIMAANEAQGSYRSHRVIYNGVDFDSIQLLGVRARNAAANPLRLVYFGQVEAAKGLLHIVEGAKRAHLQGARFSIDIIGRGSHAFQQELQEAISQGNLNSVVNQIGFFDRATLLRRLPSYDAAILLLSDQEPFAYSVIEAVACSLPVILTSGSGNAECFPTEYPLFVHDRTQADAIAGRIKWLCDNPTARTEVAQQTLLRLKQLCDLHSVTLPSYLRTIRSTPVNTAIADLNSASAAWSSAEFYSFAQA